MILGRDVLTTLGIDIKFSSNFIISDDVPHEGCLSSIVVINDYDFKSLTYKAMKTIKILY